MSLDIASDVPDIASDIAKPMTDIGAMSTTSLAISPTPMTDIADIARPTSVESISMFPVGPLGGLSIKLEYGFEE